MQLDSYVVACDLARLVKGAGGRAIAVGGWVRDQFLALESKDIDIEVFGLAPSRLEKLLRSTFRVSAVGRAFGVLKVWTPGLDDAIDVSVPRREHKTGSGHKGFEIDADPMMSFKEASRRRDLTINAMGIDLVTRELLDPSGGYKDLQSRLLRAVDPTTFVEDPLRVLRVAQFAARLLFRPVPELVELCRGLDLLELPRERLYEELRKLLIKGKKPAVGFQFLRRAGQLRIFPELELLADLPQDPKWHPEGCVFTHTMLSINAAAADRIGHDEEDFIVALAVLCHDFGKPSTTKFEDGHWRAIGHCQAGEEPTRSFLARVANQPRLVNAVVPLVVEHLAPAQLFEAQAGAPAIRRLARRVNIHRLVRVARADHLGRATKESMRRKFPAGDWLLARARDLEVQHHAPPPILLGRHLIQQGLKPGPHLGELLRRAYEAQTDGQVTNVEEGLEFLGLLPRDT